MRWRGRRQSDNVEDLRGRRFGKGASIGCGGLLIIILFAVLTGQDPQQLVDVLGGSATTQPAPSGYPPSGPPQDELGQFASVVLANTEDTWNRVLPQRIGVRYQEPKLVLFSQQVSSACGFASAAVGPFYCPRNGKLYLDLAFFRQLETRMGAPGDFAQAYVIAHEVGHHIQNLLGISGEVQRRQARLSKSEANALSVRLELQADCLAGVWGHYAHVEHRMIEPGDFEEGLRAASAIGDDYLQRQATGTTRPESWTHGSSEMRTRWLRRGIETGDPDACDTFAERRL